MNDEPRQDEIRRLVSSITYCAGILESWANEVSVRGCPDPYRGDELGHLAYRLYVQSKKARGGGSV